MNVKKIKELAKEILSLCDGEEEDMEEEDEDEEEDKPKKEKGLSLAIAFMPKKGKKK